MIMIKLFKIVCALFGIFSLADNFAQVIDQQFHTDLFIDQDIVLPSGWNIQGSAIPTSRFYQDCNGKRIFGGYKVLSGQITFPAWIAKTYTNLPPHFQVRVQAQVYKIDSWRNQKLFIMVDGITQFTYTWDSTTGSSDICGNPNPITDALNTNFNEQIFSFDQTFAHTAQTLTIKLISTLDSLAGSWGIRQYTLTLERCHETCGACTSTTCICTPTTDFQPSGSICECKPPASKRIQIIRNCLQTMCAICVTKNNCDLGYYLVPITSNCELCHQACSQCTGSSNTYSQCSVCANGYVSKGDGVDPICHKCYGTCKTCTGLSFNECQSCQYGSFLVGTECKSSCPAQYYSLQTDARCVVCVSPCDNCQGPTNGFCLSCVTGLYLYNYYCDTTCPASLYAYNGTCLEACPLRTYADTSNVCIDCPNIFCLTCNSAGQCLTCETNTYLNPMDFICYDICPAGLYGDNSTGLCIFCDNQCLTCFGPSESQCSSCHPSFFLISNTCYDQCPTHTYPDVCNPCNDICLNCTGPGPNECLNCNHSYYFHLNQSTCILECSEIQITNQIQKTCMQCEEGKTAILSQCVSCHPSCKNCMDELYCDCRECAGVDQKDRKLELIGTICVYQETDYFYMPQLSQSSDILINSILLMVLVCVGLSLILECLFMYKTNLIFFIQMMQVISYFYYLCPPLSLSTQKIMLFMYNFHPSAILTINNIVPKIEAIHPLKDQIITKAILLQKTGIFLIDSLMLHGIIVSLILFYGIAKIYKGSIYNKINPYILSYGYRLLFMEHIFCIVLFLVYIDLSDSLEIGSLLLFILDIILIGLSFFWKIKTSTELNHSHFALFYFNELGPPMNSYQQLTANQSKQRQSILPSLFFYFGKIPLIFIIFFFYKQPITQAFCLLIYSILIAFVNFAIEYRRKIMKAMSYIMHIALMIISIFILALAFEIDVTIYLDLFMLISVLIFFLVTLIQALANYLYIISLFYKGKQKLMQCFEDKQ